VKTLSSSRPSPVYLIYICYTAILNLTYFFLPVYLLGIGMSGNETGALLFTFTATALLTSFAIGCIEDRSGARGNTIAGILFMSIFYLGLLAFGNFSALLGVFFIGGLGSNLVRVTMNALFLKMHDSGRQGREIGKFNFGYQASMGIGIIAGSLLLTRLGFGVVFALSSALIIVLIAIARSLRAVTVSTTPVSRYIRELFRRRVIFFAVALILFYLHWGAEVACYTPFLEKKLRLGTTAAGIFMGTPIIFLAFSTYFFGRHRDRGISTVRLAVIAILCSGAGIILFSLTERPVVSFLFRLLHEFGDAAFVIFTYVGIARLFQRDQLGGMSGSIYFIMIGTQSVGSWIFSAIGADYGYTLPYVISGIASLCSIPLILLARRHYSFGESAE